MNKALTDGETEIGACMFRDRKKPCLCVEKGNVITIYGTFQNEECADKFMDELGEFLGVKHDM